MPIVNEVFLAVVACIFSRVIVDVMGTSSLICVRLEKHMLGKEQEIKAQR